MSEEAKVKRYLVAPLRLDQVVRDQSGVPYTSVVLASDYDALVRQLEEARAELAKVRKQEDKEIVELVFAYSSLQFEAEDIESERDALRAAIEAHNAKVESEGIRSDWNAREYMIDLPPTNPHNDDDSLNQKDSK